MAFGGNEVVVLVLLILWVILSIYFYYRGTYGDDLNPMQNKMLGALMDGKVRVIVGGGFLDNYVIYVRNNHPVVSVFAPTDYNPINGAERVGTLFILAVVAYVLTAVFNTQETWAIMANSFICLIVDMILYYFSTREDKAIVERQKDGKGEFCDEECQMRQENVEYLVHTFNERSVVARSSWMVCMGNWCMNLLVITCFVVFIVAAMGSDNLDQSWIVPWLLSFALWFGLSGGLVFIGKYCTQDPISFEEDNTDDLEGFGEPEELTIEQAKECINEWASNQCCYGEVADDIDIVAVHGKLTKKIHFDSWSEFRSSTTDEVPYDGQDYGNYNPPGNWEMEPESWVEKFETGSTCTRKPDSERKETCPKCHGSGEITSTDSEGNESTSTCPRCNGSGEVFKWDNLVVTWGIRSQEHCIDCCTCPLFIVNMSEGQEAETGESLRPVAADHEADPGEQTPSLEFQTADVFFNDVLKNFESNHNEIEEHGNARIDGQKYTIMWVPIWEVQYSEGDEVVQTIYILGIDKDIYWPSRGYGAKCCMCMNCMDCNLCGKKSW